MAVLNKPRSESSLLTFPLSVPLSDVLQMTTDALPLLMPSARIVAMGYFARLMDACSSWALKRRAAYPSTLPAAAGPGKEHCGRVLHFGASLLACYKETSAAKDWWAALQHNPVAQNLSWVMGECLGGEV